MSRYKFLRVKRNDDGNRVFVPSVYPQIPVENGDVYIVSKNGDRPDLLAHKYYKNSSLWWIISKANDLPGGTLGIKAGTTLRIPSHTGKIIKSLEISNRSW
jgi:hypothetical protein